MNFPRRLRETVDYWATTHPGSRLEELAVNFFTPKDGPGDVVMVDIALEARDTDVNQVREIRNHIARTAGRGLLDRLWSPLGPSTARSSSPAAEHE